MSRELIRFIIKILVAALLLVAAGWIVFTFYFPEKYLPVLPWMLAFFTVATVLIHSWQLTVAKKNMAKFTQNSMIVSLLRLVLYSGFAIVFLITHSENIAVFVVCIAVVYLIYTFLEVFDLQKLTKQKK
ncbi:MAG: hypothetical protein ACOCWK_05985 [Tangfeifania sp.]